MIRKLTLLVALSFTLFATTFQESVITTTLKFEGVKQDNTSKRGIEQSTLNTYNKLKGTNWKLSTLTHNQAVEIAKTLFWSDRLNYIKYEKVAVFIFDWNFNSNPSKAFKLMHRAFGLKEQSVLSLELVAKINSMNPNHAIKILYNTRLNYLKSLNIWKVYGRGWKFRLDELIK